MAARPRTLPAAIAPVLVGTAAAVQEADHLRVGAFVAALIGSVFIQVGTNLANDYSDAKRGADAADRLGPVRVTSSGLVAPRRVLVGTWVAFAVAVAAGIYLATVAGVVILIVGAASIAAGVLYTGGPRPYGYEGLGELFVFLFFGLVAVNGSYYVQLERLDWLPCFPSGSRSPWASSPARSSSSTTSATSRRIGEPESAPSRCASVESERVASTCSCSSSPSRACRSRSPPPAARRGVSSPSPRRRSRCAPSAR